MFENEDQVEFNSLCTIIREFISKVGLKVNPNPRSVARALRKTADEIDKLINLFEEATTGSEQN